MLIAVGSDHRGIEHKKFVMRCLTELGLEGLDFGSFSAEPVDYPDIAADVGKAVSSGGAVYGILICGTGIGMMMSANKRKGIRATICTNELMATASRLHNDANVLCLGSKIIDLEMAKKILEIFLKTEFEGEEKHVRRLKKMEEGYNPDDCC